MTPRLSRSLIATAIAMLAAGSDAQAASGLGSRIAQEVTEQRAAAARARDIVRQVPVLVQPTEVAEGTEELAQAGCGIYVSNGEKGTRNAKFRYEAQTAYISPFGQIVTVRESKGNVRANKQGFVSWDVPLGDVEEWLSGAFAVMFVDIQGRNNKKLDFFSARCRVNFTEPCVASETNACVGDDRFALTLGDDWEATSSNDLTAIFQNNGSQVEVDVIDTCPEGFYVTATQTGDAAAFDLEAQDLWTGERAFLSDPDEALHLSSCY